MPSERRKYPRIAESVLCRVSAEGQTWSAHTRNISCGGALCSLPKPIPLMTKLDIHFELPPFSEGSPGETIHCVGVVVRQSLKPESGGAASYATAIYFSELKPEDRRRIAEFVLHAMLSRNHRGP